MNRVRAQKLKPDKEIVMPLLDPQLKEILICPHCHGELEEEEPRAMLRCRGCGLGYSVADGFPNMLIDEAEQPAGFVMNADEHGRQKPADSSGAA